LIFADGFESGNLTAWSANVTDSGDLSVSPAAAIVGSQGLQALIDNNTAIYLTDDLPNAEIRYRMRFYFDPNSISMANGDAHYVFYGYTGTSTIILRVEFRRSSNLYQIRAALLNDGSTFTNSNWFTISDAAHNIELDWRASTAVGSNNGFLTFWIDNIQQANLTGIDNDTRRIDRVRLGSVAGIDTGTRGTYYFDAFESHQQSFIGPAAFAASSVSIPFAPSVPLVNNTAPAMQMNQTTVIVNEGQTATNTISVADADGDPVNLKASIGDVTVNSNGTWTWRWRSSDGPGDTQIVILSADDDHGHTTQTIFSLIVNNVSPSAVFTNNSGIVQVGEGVVLAFIATDASSQDAGAGFTYSYDCTGSGAFLLIDSASPQFICPYPAAGNYLAVGRIKDKDGGYADYQAVVEVQSPAVVIETQPTPNPTVAPSVTPTPETTPDQQAPPSASFGVSAASGDAPFAVIFTNQSSGEITSVIWDFGDGSISGENDPSYTYDIPGMYTVTLSVYGPGGESSLQLVINVTDPLATDIPEQTPEPDSTEEALPPV
jgi:PKD domain